MKKFIIFMFVIMLPSLTLMGQIQRYIEVGNLRYRIITEADGASTFGTVTLAAPEYEDEVYQGDINIPIAVKEFDDEYSDSYRVIGIDDGAFKNAKNLGVVELPSSIEVIGNHVFENSSLKGIIIPMGKLKTIGSYAFAGCPMKTIDLPSSVKSVGSGAFLKCSKLVNVGLKNGIVSLGDSIFYQCSNLRECMLPETLTRINDFSFWGCVNLKSITLGQKVKRIGVKAFQFCMSIRSLTLPSTLVELGEYSLSHTGISEITIPDRIRKIRQGTFFNSKMLRNVYLPNELQAIEPMAFHNCKLYEFHIPDAIKSNYSLVLDQVKYDGSENIEREHKIKNIKTKLLYSTVNNNDVVMLPIKEKIEMSAYKIRIGNNVYAILSYPENKSEYGTLELLELNDINIKNLRIPDIIEVVSKQCREKFVITKIGANAFSNEKSNIQSLELGSLVERLEYQAFAYSSFKKVKLPNIKLSGYLFYNSSIEEFVFFENIDTIPSGIFEGCKQLKYVKLPNTVKEIGEYAFCESGINQFMIPEGVKVIEKGTFKNCINLKNVTFPSGLLYLKENSFTNCGFERLDIPNTIIKVDKHAFSHNENLKEVILNNTTQIENNAFYRCTIIDVFLTSNDGIDSGAFYGSSINRLVYEDGTTDINTLRGLSSLKYVRIPSTVIKVKNMHDMRMAESVELSEGIKEISDYAFRGFYNITNVTIPSSIERIGIGAFSECNKIESVILNDGVKIIGDYAFKDSPIDCLVIPKSVKRVGYRAFYNTETVRICCNIFEWESSNVFNNEILKWYQLEIPYSGDVKRYGLSNLKEK